MCLPMDEWIMKMMHINTHDTPLHARILFSHKNNEILLFAATWMDVEGIMLSEMSDSEGTYHMTHLYVNPKKVYQAHR